MNTIVLIIIALVILMGVLAYVYRDVWFKHSSSGPLPPVGAEDPTVTHPYQPFYFDQMSPTFPIEYDYHECMQTQCKGDYNNHACRKSCYLKVAKGNTTDKVDLICYNAPDKDKCMDSVYGNA